MLYASRHMLIKKMFPSGFKLKLPLQDSGVAPGYNEIAGLLVPDRRMGKHWWGEAGQPGGVLQAEAVIRGGHAFIGP